MFTLKASSKQKQVKKTQECEIENAVFCAFRQAKIFSAMASYELSYFARQNILRHGERWLISLREQTVFTSKTQFSITQTPKLIGITAYMYFMI